MVLDGTSRMPEAAKGYEAYRYALKQGLERFGYSDDAIRGIRRAGCEPRLNFECDQMSMGLPMPDSFQKLVDEIVPWGVGKVFISEIALMPTWAYMNMAVAEGLNGFRKLERLLIPPRGLEDQHATPEILFDFREGELSYFRFRPHFQTRQNTFVPSSDESESSVVKNGGSHSSRTHLPITSEMMSDFILLPGLIADEQYGGYASSHPVYVANYPRRD